MVRPLLTFALAVGLASGPAAVDAQTTAPKRPPAKKAPAAVKPASPIPAPVAAPEPPPPPPPPTDVKVVTSYTQGAQVSQNTTYIHGPRQRVEFPGVVSLDQCDLQRTVILNPATKRYRVQADAAASVAPAPAPAPAMAAMPGMPGQPPKGGVIVFTTTLTDTLERQPMFGIEARRIRSVVTKQTTGNACDTTPLRTEVDAWYVDLPRTGAACQRAAAAVPAPPADEAGCRDVVETRVVGDVTLGFPVKVTTTTVSGEGDKEQTLTTSSEVTTLEVTTLDAGLFEVPADFVEAKSLAELAPTLGTGTSLADALYGSTADGTSTAAPKKPGTVRIGILEPVNRSTRSLPGPALRAELVAKFSKAPYEALPLRGSSASEVEADAARLECDYILLAEITEVKTSKPGKMGGMLKMASGGGPPKDSHEVKLSYRLFATDATAAPKLSGDTKASTGGFGLGSALRIAAFAGQMYMGMGGMGMMRGFGAMGGLGMGLMEPMAMMAGAGGLGSMGGAYFDPRAMAMSSMALSLGGALAGGMTTGMPGMPDASDAEIMQVVSTGFENVAKGMDEKLKKAR